MLVLVNGDRLNDHMERFKEGVRYAPLDVAEYIVIDFRSGPVTRMRQLVERATLSYDMSVDFRQILHGVEKKPDRINFTP